jgi:hypothetical protein
MATSEIVSCPKCDRETRDFCIVDGKCDKCRQEAERKEHARHRDLVSTKRDRAFGVIRDRRNQLLEQWAWTLRPDSPLTTECQAEYLAWLKALQRVTADVKKTDAPGFVFPDPPALVYAPLSEQ